MRKWILITCLVITVIWTYRHHIRSNSDEIPVRSEASQLLIKNAAESFQIDGKPFKKSSGLRPDLNIKQNLKFHGLSKNSKETPLTIEYQIEDGLAVAFGDIVLGTPKSEEIQSHGFIKPNNIQLWDSSEIPFYIQPSLPQPARVIQALQSFQQTPISFVQYNGQKDALVFQARPGNCKSYLGKVGGLQPIFLADNCQSPEILHEVMHALGFIHEHSRTDRDNYVDVLWENIDEPYKSQFSIVPESLMETVRGTPFDYQSIMIYQPNTFGRQPTLITLRSKTDNPVSPANGLSAQDIRRLFKIYGH